MKLLKQSDNHSAATRARGWSGLNLVPLLLCSALSGCASSWGNSPPSSLSPISSQGNNSASGQPPSSSAPPPPISDGAHPNQSITDLFRDSTTTTAAAPISDGAHPNQSITDLFRDSSSPQTPNVPRPPSSYTPVGQPYSPPGQSANGAPQAAGSSATAATAPPPPISDGAHPNQSITDLFRQ